MAGVHRLRVLIVDDDESDRFLLTRRLSKLKRFEPEILEARSGEEGLKRFREDAPDCVFLDFRMPTVDGLEFLRRLASERGRLAVPVIMMTSEQNEEVTLRALTLGVADYVDKGVASPELLDHVLQRALQRKAAEEEFLRNALYDTLTGDTSRGLMQERLAHMVERVQRYRNDTFSFLRLKLLGLPELIERLGYLAGDTVLIEVSRRIRRFTHAGDTVTRLAGGDFAIALEHAAGIEDGRLIAQRIADAVAEPFQLDGGPTQGAVQVAVGVAPGDERVLSVDELLGHAELAMEAAASAGPNHIAWIDPLTGRITVIDPAGTVT